MALGRRRAGLRWFWLLAFCPGGCFGGPAPIPAQPIEAYQFQETRGGVRVAVDLYLTTDRLVQAFRAGDRFAESGVLPVQLTVENGSGGEIRINPHDVRLLRPGSGPEAPLSAQDAFSLVKARIQYLALIPILGTSVTAARNEPVLRDLESREMREAAIPPGGTTTGFVYFQIPEELNDLAGSLMVVVLKGPSGRDLIHEIPVEGRRGVPAPAAPAAAAGSAGPPAPSRPAPSEPQVPSSPTRIEGAGGGVILRSPSP